MVNLAGSFSRLVPKRVLVVGDFMLDTYTIGNVRRISPEAPVSVLQVKKEEHRPGGSGNVVLNLIAMGMEVRALGRLGFDKAGTILKTAFKDESVDCRYLFEEKEYQTPLKNRIIAENQQIVRVDFEQIVSLSENLEQQIIDHLPQILEEIDIVAISDYAKGFCSKTLLEALINECKIKKIAVIVDPKGTDFSKYTGATIIKPNFSEALLASGLESDQSIENVAKKLIESTQASAIVITRSEKGIFVYDSSNEYENHPVVVKEVRDVAGAGDTVLATLTCGLASDLSLTEAVKLANVAAGLAIEHLGCAQIGLSELARRLFEMDSQNKVFDEEHLFALQKALKDRQPVILGISKHENSLTPALFSTLRKLSKGLTTDLIVYIRGSMQNEEFVSLLSSLPEVDFIVLKNHNLSSLCERIHPHKVYLFENNQLNVADHHHVLLGTHSFT